MSEADCIDGGASGRREIAAELEAACTPSSALRRSK